MEQKCENCGEVLYGAVNRCWQCGEPIQVKAVAPKLPPVRRAPVDLNSIPSEGPRVLVGSRLPFPFSVRLSPAARNACTVASVGLSAAGCLIGIASGWSLLLGLIALVCGLLGMQDRQKRDLATMGLVLAVIAIFLGTAQIGWDAWVKYDARRWIQQEQGVVP